MTGYTKLFQSILASTIWRADDKTRIVWITLLAMADRNGVCEGSVPGVADFARVSVDDCRASLAALTSPDPDSRSKESDGRRIEEIEGGWRLINHAKYRAKMSADDRRDYLTLKKRESRARQSTPVNKCPEVSTKSTHAEAEASPKAKVIKTRAFVSVPSQHPDISTELAERAGRFVERYSQLYTERRKGAKYLRRQPALDWDRACKLCETWDDARLEQMAIIFLITDDEWISGTDRGFAVFASKATWADDRLAEWEAKQRKA